MSGYNVSALRAQFPILKNEVHGEPLVYLDNAATSQKPQVVLDASRNYYELLNSNIHRGTHYLAQQATAAHEQARDTVAAHLHAGSREGIHKQFPGYPGNSRPGMKTILMIIT